MDELANPHRGEVVVELEGGRTLGLRLDANALCIAERMLQRPFTEFGAEILGRIVSVTTVRALLWAGVQGYAAKHPPKDRKKEAFSLTDAGDVINELGLSRAANLVVTALNRSLPMKEDAEGDEGGDGGGDGDDAKEGDESSRETATGSGS